MQGWVRLMAKKPKAARSVEWSDDPDPMSTLDDPSQFGGPDIAIQTLDKQPWHHIREGMPAFERFPR